MSGKNKEETYDQRVKRVWAIMEKGIKDAQPVILANTQAFEEKIARSHLEEALGAIREDIGIPIEGFEGSMEANLWLRGRLVPENVRAERMKKSEWWMHYIQSVLDLTDNYQSAIRSYLFTGKIDHIQANATVGVDYNKHEVRIIPQDHIRDAEKPFLQKMSEELLANMGRATKKFTLTDHRPRNPEKHALKIAILRKDKEKSAINLTDADIVNKMMQNESSTDFAQLASKEKGILSSAKNMRYDTLKRDKSD